MKRCFQTHARIAFQAALVVLCVIAQVTTGQTDCQPCGYKASTSATEIYILIENNDLCTIENASLEYTPTNIIVTGLEPGSTYSLLINCSDSCCANFSTDPALSSLTVILLNTTSVSLNWTGPPVPSNATLTLPPETVTNLSVSNVTVSSVSVSWAPPAGKSASYRVTWAPADVGLASTSDTSISVTGLAHGTKYTFSVKAVATDNQTEGSSTEISQNTRPAKVKNVTVSQRGNSTLALQWVAPEGHVDNYEIALSNNLNTDGPTTVNALSYEFIGLSAGREYNFTVTSVSGILRNASDIFPFATEPNPPESLNATSLTNSSILVQWMTPLLMEGVSVSYEVAYTSSQSSNTTFPLGVSNTSVQLSLEASGTEYSISVATVSYQGLKSSAVQLYAYTLPNPVQGLQATPASISSIRLDWEYPTEAQSSYAYVVKISPAEVQDGTSAVNTSTVNGLQPGTQYNCSVTSRIAAANIFGSSVSTPCYTKPKPVSDLVGLAINSTAITLTWAHQVDHLYVVTMDGSLLSSNITDNNITVGDLTPGTRYSFTVTTVANGVSSNTTAVTTHTLVEKASIVSAIGTTTTMTVTWTKPAGYVEHYEILIEQNGTDNQVETEMSVKPVVFSGLLPGRDCVVAVIAVSGQTKARSQDLSNATLPNPPGNISMALQTVDSLSLTWGPPSNMTIGEYSFQVSYANQTVSAVTTSATLSGLASGTLYTVTVRTVGVRSYLSDAITASVDTRPRAVNSLQLVNFTTRSVAVSWQQPEPRDGFTYQVTKTLLPNGSEVSLHNVGVTMAVIEDLLSGSQYNISVTTQTMEGTCGQPAFITTLTKPYPVTELAVSVFNETALTLNWSRPLEYQSGFSYRVIAECPAQTTNFTTSLEQLIVSDLGPGTKCNFTAFSSANGVEGDGVTISSYTRPPTVTPSVSNEGTNNSIDVTWVSPGGGVEMYVLNISGGDWASSTEVNPSEDSHEFGNLTAATVYTVVLTTVSGSFTETSAPVSNATYPNPPGSVRVLHKSTDSILLEWDEAQGMVPGTFNYSVTCQSSTTSPTHLLTETNTTLLANLSSGTPYSISVTTVGPMGFSSVPKLTYFVTTRPLGVQALQVTVTATDLLVAEWGQPVGYQTGYAYRVNVSDGGRFVMVENTTTESTTVRNLTAGTSYDLSVQTLIADGTSGEVTSISSCTDAAQVRSLSCSGPNLTLAMLSISWVQPGGSFTGYSIQLTHSSVGIPAHVTNASTQYNFTQLQYDTQYNVTLTTHSCGKNSSAVEISCKTGITRPPMPENLDPEVEVSETQYNMFSLTLRSSLFNDTNGLILNFGVLVTSDTTGSSQKSSSSFDQFLSKTHDEWEAGETTTYLAFLKECQGGCSSNGPETVVVIGDDTKSQGYTNGQLSAKGTYSFAVVTFTHLVVDGSQLIVSSQSYYSLSNFYQGTISLPENPAVIGGAIGGAVGAFAVILLIAIVLFFALRRKKNKEESPGVPFHPVRTKVSTPIKVEDYESHYLKQRADSFCGFAAEFEDLKPVGVNQAKNSALAPENKAKNRYNNVLPYDMSRVKLSIHGSPFDDYINANYIPGYMSKKEFIAAQGPLPVTVNEFWRMIWEKNVHTLVMLTRCNEQGRVKCEEYWPTGSRHFNHLTVTTTSEIPLDDWTIREFDLKNIKTAESRSVRHFHFTAWPDHGVPETTELLISFRHLVREHMDQYSRHSPTLVHCSAGVGRTGTFIAIDRLIYQIERDGVVDVYGIIHDLRMHRPLMVQTEDQYVFLNQCAIDIIRSRTGTNVDLIYQNTAALSIYENFEPMKKPKNGYHKA